MSERIERLEKRLEEVIDVVEEIIHARWCEGRSVDKQVSGGSLGTECCEEDGDLQVFAPFYDRLFEGRKGKSE